MLAVFLVSYHNYFNHTQWLTCKIRGVEQYILIWTPVCGCTWACPLAKQNLTIGLFFVVLNHSMHKAAYQLTISFRQSTVGLYVIASVHASCPQPYIGGGDRVQPEIASTRVAWA